MTGSETDEGSAAVLAAAAELDRRGVLSASGHGNVSVRIAGRDEILYTAHPSLRTVGAGHLVRVALTGELLDGLLPPLSADAVRMHLAVYRARPDTGGVVHTHSPFATAYAVAGRPIGCWAEPLAIFDMTDGVPLAPYARRGSPDAVQVVEQACAPAGVRAVLLQNHGVLSFGDSPAAAVHVATLVEEAAQLGIYATALGGPVLLPPNHGPS